MSMHTAPPDSEIEFDIGSEHALDHMIELFARHGDIYRLYMPGRRRHAYVIHHPDDVKRVLVANHRNYIKGVDRDRIRMLLGLGLMTSEGDLWRRQRHMMQPMFHRRMVTRFTQMIEDANDRLIEKWTTKARKHDVVDLTAEISDFVLETLLRMIFGRDATHVLERFGVVAHDSARDLQFVYKFRELATLVREVRVNRQLQKGDEDLDYVSMLLAARDRDSGDAMSEQQFVDEIMTLVVAGHETTASTLNWTWFLLTKHREADDRLVAAVASQPCPTPTDFDAMESCGYAGRVVNEVMRLYPPGWLLSRRTIEPDVLCGYAIPASADVLIPLYIIHRHPRYWDNADLFEPDRFLSARSYRRPRYAFMPFSAGPRHCIGETLALYEMLVHIWKVIPNFRMSPVAERPIQLEAQINLRTRNPFRTTISRRT